MFTCGLKELTERKRGRYSKTTESFRYQPDRYKVSMFFTYVLGRFLKCIAATSSIVLKTYVAFYFVVTYDIWHQLSIFLEF